jgi:flagellar M-ring protein FliF
LLAKINGTLEPLLGPDKFRASVSVDCDFSAAEQSEETFDPTKSVMVSSQKTEDISGGATTSGIPGTASNLPKPATAPAPVTKNGGGTRSTENISYQSSHTIRHVRLPQGSVKRMSVALLVDSMVRYEGSGPKAKRIVEAPSAEKLKTIRDLVSGVIGFSTERGDQLVVETMAFESTLNPEPLSSAPAPVAQRTDDWIQQAFKNKYLPLGGGIAVAVVLTLIVLVLRLARRKPSASVEMAPQLPAAPGDDFGKKIETQLAEQAALREKQEAEALNALKLPPVTKKAEVLTKHIAEQAKKDSTPMAHVLRSWMSERAPKT